MPGALVASRSKTQTIDGLSFQDADSLVAVDVVKASETLAAAATGVLTIRTNGTDGSLTMTTGHGITTGARLDIYWSGGSCRGALVGTVATNVVPFTAATGTALPAAATAITAMVPSEKVFNVVGNNCTAIGGGGDAAFTVVWADGSNVEKHFVVRTGAGGAQWQTGDDATNPLAGDTPTKVFLSHGSPAQAVNVRAACLY